MKRRFFTVMMFALLAALTSSTVLYKIVSASSTRGAKIPTVPVVVAARDLAAGALVADGDLRVVQWPEASGSQLIRRREDAIGRSLLTPVGKDEPFAENRLAAKGAGSGLASRIPHGMRAVAVHVDELTGLTRFIFPGTHVDVISTSNSGGPGGGVTKTILQNVEVFGTGQGIEKDSKDKPAVVQSVNLLVTPQQAEVLSQAVAQTRIELVLRNPLDTGSYFAAASSLSASASPLKTMKSVFHAASRMSQAEQSPPVKTSAPAPAAAAAPAGPTIEVIHGSKRVVTAVDAATEEELAQ